MSLSDYRPGEIHDGETAFSVDAAAITFGAGCLGEAGDVAGQLGIGRICLMTDQTLAAGPHVAVVETSLRDAGVDVVVFDAVHIEPTDESFRAATQFAARNDVDGYISVGGGSVIDTAKAANLYATYPADFLDYVNAPIGAAKPVPGPLKPHIACPTTSGTGSECTGIAVFDLLEMGAKTGIASRSLRPTRALIDPTTTTTLPPAVVASSAFDVLSHALESYTARPFLSRRPPAHAAQRPTSQGANPWSDMGCRQALQIIGRFLERAVTDASDTEARHQLMWAATLAGIAFGNAGCHAPHGMSYSVSGLVKHFRPPGYPDRPIIPHGMSVVLNAPAVFRRLASSNPARHLDSAAWLGADVRDVEAEAAGAALAARIIELMQVTGMPNGLSGVGYAAEDIPALVEGAWPQQRLLSNAPLELDRETLAILYREAMAYW